MSSRDITWRLLPISCPVLFALSGCCLFQGEYTAMKPVQPGAPAQVVPALPPSSAAPRGQFRSNRPVPIYGYTPRPQPQARPAPVIPDAAPTGPVLGDEAPEYRARPTPIQPAPVQPQPEQRHQPPAGPQLLPIEPPAAAALELKVSVDRRAQLGGGATFEIVVHNATGQAIEEVVIEAEFDEALLFPGRPEKKIRRSLGKLEAGRRRELAVMLTSETAGRHCARFALFADGQEAASENTCVEFVGKNANNGARRTLLH